MELKEAEILIARLKPGDTVVLKTERILPMAAKIHLGNVLKEKFSEDRLGFEVETLVLHGGLELEIVRKEDS